MKKQILLVSIIFFFLAVGLSGCEELESFKEPNYVTVNVYADARVYVTIRDWGVETIYLPNMAVNLKVLKDGAVKSDRTFNTEQNGKTPEIFVTVKLYKEQDVVVKGWLRSNIPEMYSDKSWVIFDYATLTWDQVRVSTGYGETYTWWTTLDFYGRD